MSNVIDDTLNSAVEKLKIFLTPDKPRFKSKEAARENQRIQHNKFEHKRRRRKIANASRNKNRRLGGKD